MDMLFMVPVRANGRPPMAIKASARSKTLPAKALAKEALCGVDGTVACTAGPRAALWGVMGIDTCVAAEFVE